MNNEKEDKAKRSQFIDSLLHPKEKVEGGIVDQIPTTGIDPKKDATDIGALKAVDPKDTESGQVVPPTNIFDLDNYSIRVMKLTAYHCILYRGSYIMSEDGAPILWHHKAFGIKKLCEEVKGKVIRADKALKFMNRWNIKFKKIIVIGKIQRKGAYYGK